MNRDAGRRRANRNAGRSQRSEQSANSRHATVQTAYCYASTPYLGLPLAFLNLAQWQTALQAQSTALSREGLQRTAEAFDDAAAHGQA